MLLDNNFFLSSLRGPLKVCPNTSSNGLNPRDSCTYSQQIVVDGYPRPNLPLFRNSRSSLCSSVFGATFRELFDFEGDMRLTYTVWLQARAWRVEICHTTLEPWSDWIELGRPTGVKSLVKALTMTLHWYFSRARLQGIYWMHTWWSSNTGVQTSS